MAANMGKVFAYAPPAAQAHTDKEPATSAPAERDYTAKPVEEPVDMADLRRKVMERHKAVRAYLAR